MKKYSVMGVFVMVAVIIGLCGVAQASLNDGLIAYYPFNGNANDESGNGNHGVEYGGMSYADGIVEQAGSFDGVDDFIEITPSSDVTAVGDFTISVWTYLIDWKKQSTTASRADRQYIFDGHTHSKTVASDFYRPGFAIIYDKEEIHNFIYLNKGTRSEQNTAISIKGTWHHHVFMRIGDADYTYFDGKLLDSTYSKNSKINDLLDMQHNWFIGTFSGNNPNYTSIRNGFNYSFFGLLDEMYIYNRAFSESEIQELYKEGSECEGKYTEADLEAAREEARQACLTDPSSCGIELGGGYDEGYKTGQQACIDDPASCGIKINNTDFPDCAASFDMFTNTLHIPNFQDSYWLDFGLNSWEPVIFELKNLGDIGSK